MVRREERQQDRVVQVVEQHGEQAGQVRGGSELQWRVAVHGQRGEGGRLEGVGRRAEQPEAQVAQVSHQRRQATQVAEVEEQRVEQAGRQETQVVPVEVDRAHRKVGVGNRGAGGPVVGPMARA